MKPRVLTWSIRICLIAALVSGAGCAARGDVRRNLMAEGPSLARNEGVAETYQVGCPDVLAFEFMARPELNGKQTVDTDGRIHLGEYGSVRVEGLRLREIAQRLAKETGTEPDEVQVRVLEYRSQYVTLFGQVSGLQRPVPFQGQETVLDLLQRIGGLTPGAEPGSVYLVRTHLEGIQRSEMFHVDLAAIVLKNEMRTNIRVLPYDQIYVGESRQARFEKTIPVFLRPVIQAVWSTQPAPAGPSVENAPLRSRWISGPRAGETEESEAIEAPFGPTQ